MTNLMSTTSILMRRASIADAARIRTLAYLDDKRLPAGPFLVAELGDDVVAAMSLSSGTVVADPFRRTADVVAMLRLRGTQVGDTSELQARRAARRPVAEQSSHSFEHAVAA
jgi:hypothetical protein